MVTSLVQQKQIWNLVLDKIKNLLQQDIHLYQTFFEDTSLYSIEGNILNIVVGSSFCKQFFQQEDQSGYQTMYRAVLEVMESDYQLNFLTKEEINSNTMDIKNKKEEKKVPFFANCILNPKYTFDNFVSGDCNKEAIQASLLIATNPGISYNPLFIYSKPGLGKTHLLHALGNYYKEKYPGKRVQYISTDNFVTEFVKYVRGNQETENLKDYFETIDLLLIDDIQTLQNKKATCDLFFTIFNQFVNSGRQIVLTSDRAPNDLQGVEERLVSRFNMGLSISMRTPDFDTMLKILEKKIISNQLSVRNFDPDGLAFLAQNFSKNVRDLEGALNRVIFYTITFKHLTRIDLETIKESVSPMLKQKKGANITEEDIIEEVASYYNMTDSQITSKVRTSQIALARRIAMYLCREMLNTPYLKIGKIFGGRDHSTVITAVVKVETELKTDTQLQNAISAIKKRLKK